nr:hypothetical protein [Tanacetum cinerariifolium]
MIAATVMPRFILFTHSYTNPYQVVFRAQVISRCRGTEIIIAKAVDSPSEATGMTGAILAMSRLKDFVNSRPLSNDSRPSPAPPQTDPIRSLVIRTGIPEFEGRLFPDDFLDWLRKVDRIFDLRDTHDYIKVKLVAIQLKKSASLWWDHVQNQRYRKENEKQTIARFLGSLRTDISDVVYLQQYYSFHDVCSHATQSATCPVRVGPIKADPPALTGDSPTSTTSSLCCFNCQRIGHLKRDCPNKHFLTLIDEADPLYDTEDEVETEVVYPDRGELLVTRRLLNVDVLDQDDDTTWLRTNIFRTQCTTKSKICTVIIDGGNCKNMVSTTMVEKLGLPIQNHPDPYQFTWLKKGNLVKVTHRCLVHFSVGNKYTDELWCEVIPMDASHILLGCPWLYDRRVKHDGYRNTYIFKKDGVSITFARLNPKDAPPDRVLISKTDFVGIVKVSSPSVVFGLLMTKENPVIAAASLLMVPLLNEFKYVFPEELPAGLPVIHEIVSLHDVPRSITSDRDVNSTGRSPFFIVYGRNPFTPLDLAPMVGDGSVSVEGDERARQIKELHAQAEFAYNRSNHSSTGRSPFFIVYGRNPFTPLHLAPMVGDGSVSAEGDERALQIKELHAQGRVVFLEGEDDMDQGGSPLSPTQAGSLESG